MKWKSPLFNHVEQIAGVVAANKTAVLSAAAQRIGKR
jgi:hypothetical protein